MKCLDPSLRVSRVYIDDLRRVLSDTLRAVTIRVMRKGVGALSMQTFDISLLIGDPNVPFDSSEI